MNKLINNCSDLETDGDKSLRVLEQSLSEIQMKKENFELVFSILKDLEGAESRVIEPLFKYKILDKEEFIQESNDVTKDYKNGLLDPTKNNSKYQ